MPSINFLRERRRKLTKQQKFDFQAFRVTSVVCVVAVVLLVATVSARLALAMMVSRSTQEQNRLMTSIKQQETNERTYLVFAAKLKALSELLAQRQDKQLAITYFSTIFGEGVLVSDISYDGDAETLTFGLKAADVFTLEKVLQVLKSEDVKQQFEGVKTDAISRSTTAEYQTTVTIVLKKDSDQ